MTIFVVRHGLSQANNRENIGTPAFGNRDASLMNAGREQARTIPARLFGLAGAIDVDGSVATSTLRRTKETAREAGFSRQHEYPLLDEIELGVMSGVELRAVLDVGKLPQIARDAAASTLDARPEEQIWFSHGLRIAGLCALLGVYQDERLIPRFGEIRQLPL